MQVAGTVALVTGASRGIGRAIALELGRRGAAVALVARDRAALEAVAHQIGEGRACVFPADLADLDQLQRAYDAVVSRFGRIDILVNNAGVVAGRPFLQTDVDTLARIVDINYRAAVVLTRLAMPAMAARRSGHIVNIASHAGVAGMAGEATYAGTKAAMRLFTGSLRPEAGAHSIGLTDVVIGFTETDMLTDLDRNPLSKRIYTRTQRLRLMPTIPAQAVAVGVGRAIERRQEVLVLPGWTRFAYLPLQGVTRMISRLLAVGR